jgi:hypothetical protein
MWTAVDKLACAKRELTRRIREYARDCAKGRMTQESAGREIAIMSAICEDYRRQVEEHDDLAEILDQQAPAQSA